MELEKCLKERSRCMEPFSNSHYIVKYIHLFKYEISTTLHNYMVCRKMQTPILVYILNTKTSRNKVTGEKISKFSPI